MSSDPIKLASVLVDGASLAHSAPIDPINIRSDQSTNYDKLCHSKMNLSESRLSLITELGNWMKLCIFVHGLRQIIDVLFMSAHRT